MALYQVLRRQDNRGHSRSIPESDGAILTEIGRSTSGGASLYTDANTTSVTIGGGAGLSALLDLSSTNPSTIRSHSGQNLQVAANGAASLVLQTNSFTRIEVVSGGGVRVGASTAASDPGDFSAGDGVSDLLWDTSAASLDFTAATTIRANGAGLDLTLGARGATYALNDVSNTALTTTNQTVIGAINEVKASADLAGLGEEILATVTSIDATSTGATNLYTATATTIITKVVLLCTAATDIDTAAIVGVGVAAGEDDVFTAESLDGLTTANKVFIYLTAGTRPAVLNTEILKLGIDTGATGAGSPSQTITAYVIGYEA